MLDHEWFCERAEKEISTFAGVLADVPDTAAAVPSTPGWTVRELTRHVGAIHRWATAIVETEATARIPFPEADLPWDSADGLAQWLISGAAPLLTALRAAGPLTAVWSWGPGRTSGWWARRMLHETTVHRVDAELALGVPDPVIDPVVAADGIDEFLFNLPSARRPYPHLASLPTGASLHLHATDVDGEWVIRFTDSGIAWERGHEKATTAVRGPVTSLLLFTYGRRPATDPRLAAFGDESVPA
ncbi:MAG TPA: maleylpyruvate isomerase family mycothiol-dependent enzyme, partial [Trebonia sp.]|nr:maleylpyruvate isomerase family mycothiol-dependent enzyme [Trebonia sp.]